MVQHTNEGELDSVEDGTWCWSAYPTGKTQGWTRAGLHCWRKEVTLMSREKRSMESDRYRVILLELGVPREAPLHMRSTTYRSRNWGLRAEALAQSQTQESVLDRDKPDQVSRPPPSSGLLLSSALPAKILLQEAKPQESQSQQQSEKKVLFIFLLFK